jgi:hypothetical protein
LAGSRNVERDLPSQNGGRHLNQALWFKLGYPSSTNYRNSRRPAAIVDAFPAGYFIPDFTEHPTAQRTAQTKKIRGAFVVASVVHHQICTTKVAMFPFDLILSEVAWPAPHPLL